MRETWRAGNNRPVPALFYLRSMRPKGRGQRLPGREAHAKRQGGRRKTKRCKAGSVLSEFWVFQEKVDMKVSAFSFTTSLLVFGYL